MLALVHYCTYYIANKVKNYGLVDLSFYLSFVRVTTILMLSSSVATYSLAQQVREPLGPFRAFRTRRIVDEGPDKHDSEARGRQCVGDEMRSLMPRVGRSEIKWKAASKCRMRENTRCGGGTVKVSGERHHWETEERRMRTVRTGAALDAIFLYQRGIWQGGVGVLGPKFLMVRSAGCPPTFHVCPDRVAGGAGRCGWGQERGALGVVA
ncbi:hypothetical protein BDN70DRAFT_900507 [Pholiota conissans]|uniref:Uncharacterized protein n=1 Tax=Pholiota conissans TaxID=109636 RepID=A0A9P5YPS9_9AGAR|nr:hypothetical protein BDN70DRAFT_900507 [Pholiota conissans]